MKIEKLPSGSYRARKSYNGIRYCVTFDHKPSDKELAIAFAERIMNDTSLHGTFEYYAQEYIKNRSNVISPATIRTYNIKLNQLSHAFKSTKINNISTEDVQKEINKFSETHEPKTVITLHGFIASVLGAYRPSLK